MTNEEIIQDLKQFIAAAVSQSEKRINDHLGGVETRLGQVETRLGGVETGLSGRISDLEAKVDTIHDAIADTFAQANQSTESAIQDHDQRLRRLEQQRAAA